jgi:hypothetical protein
MLTTVKVPLTFIYLENRTTKSKTKVVVPAFEITTEIIGPLLRTKANLPLEGGLSFIDITKILETLEDTYTFPHWEQLLAIKQLKAEGKLTEITVPEDVNLWTKTKYNERWTADTATLPIRNMEMNALLVKAKHYSFLNKEFEKVRIVNLAP